MHAMWHKTGNTLPVMVNGRQTGNKKGSGAAHQQELRPAEDQLGDATVLLPLELALDFPKEEGMMQQSSVSISLSF